MERTITYLFALSFVQFVITYICGLVPLLLKPSKSSLLTSFGGGVLVGVAFVVVVPEGINLLTSANSEEPGRSIGIPLLLGFALMYTIDCLSPHSHSRAHNEAIDLGTNQAHQIAPQKSGKAVTGLLIHAAADGLALGASFASDGADSDLILVFIAMLVHKAPTAFGLAAFLVRDGVGRRGIRFTLALFSAMAPLAGIFTYLCLRILSTTLHDGTVTGTALLFSGGTFIYVSAVHVLPEVTGGSILETVGVISGMGFPLAIAMFLVENQQISMLIPLLLVSIQAVTFDVAQQPCGDRCNSVDAQDAYTKFEPRREAAECDVLCKVGSFLNRSFEQLEMGLKDLDIIETKIMPEISNLPIEQHNHLTGAERRAWDILRVAADAECACASYLLGFGSLSNRTRNAKAAHSYFTQLAQTNSTGSRMLALMYATGVGTPRSPASALVHANIAALAGDIPAMHQLAYYSHAGITVPKSCDLAASWYAKVADHLAETFLNGQPGGFPNPRMKVFVDADFGGIYGSGASSDSSPRSRLRVPEILMLYKLQADAGDPASQLRLGEYYYRGTQKGSQDFTKALRYFRLAAKQYRDSKPSSDTTNAAKSAASRACGYLGNMYWRGEGVIPNIVTARKWYERGSAQEDTMSYNGLGMMHASGLAGLDKNSRLALKKFEDSAEADEALALVNLAEMLMHPKPLHKRESTLADEINWGRVVELLLRSSTQGYSIAYYYLGKIYKTGKFGIDANCKLSTTYLKKFVEKSSYHDMFIPSSYQSFLDNDYESAFIGYLFAAEVGFEVAQVNAAFIIDSGKYSGSSNNVMHITNQTRGWDIYETALPLWIRSSNQGNLDAVVKCGDYFYYGLGIVRPMLPFTTKYTNTSKVSQHIPLASQFSVSYLPKNELRTVPDYKMAAMYYQHAASSNSALGMFNLAWMYEHALGVTRDFPLAKRYYENAKESDPKSEMIVMVFLAVVRVKWMYHSVFGEKETDEKLPPPPADVNEPEIIASSFAEENLNVKVWAAFLLCVGMAGLLALRTRLLYI